MWWEEMLVNTVRDSVQWSLYLGFQKLWIYSFLPSLPQTR